MSPLDQALANVVERKQSMTAQEFQVMDQLAAFMKTCAAVYGCDAATPEFRAAWLLACSFLSRLAHQESGDIQEVLEGACQELTTLGMWSSLFSEMDLPQLLEENLRTTH